ncbi:MAG TPA: dipeptidase [Gemmatimonadaceae bacterium]|nr:dipeptidase [Gemmatimonadaceae bacterium]
MSPRLALLAVAASACASASSGAPTPAQTAAGAVAPVRRAVRPSGVSERAMRVYESAYVVDTHNDMPTKMLDEGYDPAVRHPAGFAATTEGHTDVPRLVESGITAQFWSAWVDAPYAARTPDQSYERALAYVDTIRAFVRRHPNELLFATTAADVERAKREGKVASLIGVEGGHAIEASLDNLGELHRRGVRYLTLTWNNGNQWAGSSVGVNGTRTGGLTDFGREVVREMNRLGMLVDVSHVSEATFADAVAASRDPVIASHSSARGLTDHPRNLTDDQLRAVARNGGVVNVNFFSRFIDPEVRAYDAGIDESLRALRDSALRAPGAEPAAVDRLVERRRAELAARAPRTPLSVLIDHIDHIARVAGADHVGLGSDFDGVSALPEGMEDVTALPRIAQGLLDRGYSEENVRKILGGNMMRVMRVVLDRR